MVDLVAMDTMERMEVQVLMAQMLQPIQLLVEKQVVQAVTVAKAVTVAMVHMLSKLQT